MLTSFAIVLRIVPLTETSLIIHWLTKNHGLIKTVAKGARRKQSQFAGNVDLFVTASIAWRVARRGDLHTLCEVAECEYREPLRHQYTTLLLASYCSQLLESALEAEPSDVGPYELLERLLNYLLNHTANLKAMLHFEKELAKLLGIYHPDIGAIQVLSEYIGHVPRARSQLLDSLRT